MLIFFRIFVTNNRLCYARKKDYVPKMIYQVHLDELVPQNNFYRLLDRENSHGEVGIGNEARDSKKLSGLCNGYAS